MYSYSFCYDCKLCNSMRNARYMMKRKVRDMDFDADQAYIYICMYILMLILLSLIRLLARCLYIEAEAQEVVKST